VTHTSIHPGTTLGAVHLTVSDLARAIAFYEERLGFRTRLREQSSARLGAGGADLLVLHEERGAKRVRGTTGLYHFAVLVPSRRDLARSLAHLVETETPLTGAADHLVSEALYLSDPDDNGIEICRDRPRAEWRFDGGFVRMATDPLDADGVLSELGDDDSAFSGLAVGTRIGHMHLHVAGLDAAQKFYVDVLGFDLMLRFGPSALFVSAGGYHHHIGLNTWAGVGAPAPPAGSVGLRYFVVRLPDEGERDRVVARAREAGVEVETVPEGVAVRDPSGNRIVLVAGAEG
jgi:catechol 2,3-dioxygenase